MITHSMEIRVRYRDCDPMGVVHHTNYALYFELARTEMLRSIGGSYRDMERDGVFFVVAELRCRFLRAARYDDVLTVETTVAKLTRARIELNYKITLGQDVITTGATLLAAVDRQGVVQPIPDLIYNSFTQN